MAKMKKVYLILKILFLVISFIFLISLFYPRPITPDGYYHISKKQRLNIINNLTDNCLSENVTYLTVTYREILNDEKNSNCWRKYINKCFKNKENNLSLKIPIKCKIY